MSPLTYPSSPASLGLSFHPISLNISSRRNCTKVVEKYLSAKTSLEMGDNSQSFIFPRLLSLSPSRSLNSSTHSFPTVHAFGRQRQLRGRRPRRTRCLLSFCYHLTRRQGRQGSSDNSECPLITPPTNIYNS